MSSSTLSAPQGGWCRSRVATSFTFAWVMTAVMGGVLGAACEGAVVDDVPPPLLGDGFAGVSVIDDREVVVRFVDDLVADSADTAFSINNFTVVPPALLVPTVSLEGAKAVSLRVDEPFVAGERYTIVVDDLKTKNGRRLTGTVNFTAIGTAATTTVEFVIADVELARRHQDLSILATVADDGSFSESLEAWPLVDEGGRFVARLTVAVDPARTVDPADDGDLTADHRPYAVLLVDGFGRLASALTPFAVASAAPRTIALTVLPPLEIVDQPTVDPLPAPPVDENPADGLKVVRLVVDDRAAAELKSPQLTTSFGANGQFDAAFPQTLTLTPMTGDDAGYWEATVQLAVDPNRVLEGSTADTFPYIAFLVEEGTAYEALSVSVIAPDETPQTVRLSLGNPDWTPVTFRVDASRAYLNTSGSERGVRGGEAVFLTGEWQQAVDALGGNCGDAFSGGEQTCLRMAELAGFPGVWTRTIWLPPGRPYGWKVVRCDAVDGCAPLNRLVSSSGRAFATVMKNLATDNVDAFADANVGLVDVVNPSQTQAGGGIIDYTNATVFQGAGIGSEPDPSGTPDGARMFKQEVPDLVVVVQAQPIVTRVVHVASWRDVNLGFTPQQIIADELSVALGTVDYDDGFIGRFPPSRENP